MIKHSFFRKLLLPLALCGAMVFLIGGCGKKDKDDDQVVQNSDSVGIDENQGETIASGIRVGGVDIGGQNMEQARQSIQSEAEKLRNQAQITLSHEGSSWQLSSSDIGLSVDVQETLNSAMTASAGADVQMSWKTDSSALNAKLEEIAAEINTEATEPTAQYTPDGPDRFAFIDGIAGKALDVAALNANVQASIAQGDLQANLSMPVQTEQPKLTTQNVKDNMVRITLAETSFSGNGSSSRVKNLQLGCKKINGVLVKPGREFSFNDVVGPRDAKSGWEKAATIVNGNTFEDDYGGGICQVSTTLYNAVLKSDLKISKRNKHSIPSSYVPYGLDATVAYGSKDFKFVNNTDYPIYIFANVDTSAQKLYVSIYGRPLPSGRTIKLRSETVKETSPSDPEVVQDFTMSPGSTTVLIKERKGYTVKVTKEYVIDGKTIDTVNLYTDTYSPVQGVVKVGARASTEGPVNVNPEIDDNIPDETENPTQSEVVQTQTPAENPVSTPAPAPEEPVIDLGEVEENEPVSGDSVDVTELIPDSDGSIDIPEE